MISLNHEFSGTHIICDAYEVQETLLVDYNKIESIIKESVSKAGASLIKIIKYSFNKSGFTLVALLKESHISLHTYPERNAIFIDVFTCGRVDPSIIINNILDYYKPLRHNLTTIKRGFYK